jgi:spore germination protein KB
VEEEKLTYKQGISLIILFISGSSAIITPGIAAKKDIWLATILAMIAVTPILILFERLLYLFKGKDLYDIIAIIFGPILGKGIIIIYIWFSLHLGALVINNFMYFINVIGLNKTPIIIPAIFIIIICIMAVKYGLYVVARWGEMAVILLNIFIGTLILLLIPYMNVQNIRPVLYNGIKPVLRGAFSTFAFPFGELVIFTMVFTSFHEKGKPKIYIIGMILGGIILVLTSLTDVLVLGVDMVEIYYFSAYSVVKRVDFGDFIQRIEIFTSLMFLIGGIIKISICLFAASRGVSKLFNSKNYKFSITPIGIIMVVMGTFIYDSIMDMRNWAIEIWPYYAFPFQVILPVIIYVWAEIYVRKSVKKIKETE